MNKLIAALVFVCMITSCNIRNTRQKGDVNAMLTGGGFTDTTSVQMIDSTYNFGSVNDGEKVEYSYRFRNTGKKPLIVSSAVASCGCTVPEKPEEPIKPGETGFLKVVFNSKGRVGPVHKEITVTSNAYPKFPVLQLTGDVKAVNN
ncbi:MAG: DUF1573 domain-containing protein [Bacteroidota bacterium]|nr:DUF1573 domain-containing protein [Bacteroidota bacterium]